MVQEVSCILSPHSQVGVLVHCVTSAIITVKCRVYMAAFGFCPAIGDFWGHMGWLVCVVFE